MFLTDHGLDEIDKKYYHDEYEKSVINLTESNRLLLGHSLPQKGNVTPSIPEKVGDNPYSDGGCAFGYYRSFNGSCERISKLNIQN